jgi:hypothetical protein
LEAELNQISEPARIAIERETPDERGRPSQNYGSRPIAMGENQGCQTVSRPSQLD